MRDRDATPSGGGDATARTYAPETAQIIRDAYVLASRTLARSLTSAERQRLAKTIVDLAAGGCLDAQRLATRAIIRNL